MKVKIKPRVPLGILAMGVVACLAMQWGYKDVALVMAAGVVSVTTMLVEIERKG